MSLARNRLIALASTAGLAGALGCGGNVANDAASGGSPSTISNQHYSGGSVSTGGSASFNDRCNGMFSGLVCSATSVQATQSCDIPLKMSPTSPLVDVAIDCQPIPLVPNNETDAGNVDGFAIDYNKIPAHLVLLGSSCARLQVSGVHNIDVVQRCFPPT